MSFDHWVFYSMPAADSDLLLRAVRAAHRKSTGRLRKMLKRALEILNE